MEQIIPIIKFLKKNRFWITCGGIALAAFVTWYLAASSLYTERIARQKKIDGMVTNANNIIGTGSTGIELPVRHPNESTKKGMVDEIDKASVALLKAWKIRRDAQERILKWPDISNQDFLKTFSELQPAEKYIDQFIAVKWEAALAVYQKEIPKRMDVICDIIGAKWEFGENSKKTETAPTGGLNATDVRGQETQATPKVSKEPAIVEWASDNQKLWHDKLTKFRGRDGQMSVSDAPTPIQVIALQQDLWLLEAICEIIKEVNGDASANDLAVVKRIDHVVVGREARGRLGSLTVPDRLLAPAGVELPATNAFETNAEVAFDPFPGEGLEKYGPFHGRYVDADFKPIPAKTLYDVLNSIELPKENLELLVAKRVPVRIAVNMDSQKIDDFIAACGNSNFAFEVWQVRIERPRDPIQLAGIESDLSSGGDGRLLAAASGDGGRGGRGGGGARGGDGGAESTSTAMADGRPQVHLRTNSDVNVEFYGIVKIYNPVDEAVITGTKKDSVNPNPNP